MAVIENNSLKDLMDFFGTEQPVGPKEMGEFWKSLSDDEKEYYKSATLS